MSAMARTRNVEDPATVSEFAEVVRDPDVIDALMVITLADGMGTSDEGWSDWKEQMVWRLYHQTKEYIADSEGFLAERAQRREELHGEVTRLLPSEFTEELEAHFAGMEERYFLSHDAQEIGSHIRLFRRFFTEGLGKEGPNLEAVVEWIDHAEAGHAEVLVCGWDRERLLERISAAFLEAGINILGADINTRDDGLVLDIFRVSNHRNEPLPKQRERDRFEKRLGELLSLPGSRALPKSKRPVHARDENEEEELPVWVVVNNNAHPDSTILELQAPDKLGMLYHLLRGISHGGIVIKSARIATESRAALDAFYLVNRLGEKITDRTDLLWLERRIRTAVRMAGDAA
jgi:[protein-PII] uridylyltransferase